MARLSANRPFSSHAWMTSRFSWQPHLARLRPANGNGQPGGRIPADRRRPRVSSIGPVGSFRRSVRGRAGVTKDV